MLWQAFKLATICCPSLPSPPYAVLPLSCVTSDELWLCSDGCEDERRLASFSFASFTLHRQWMRKRCGGGRRAYVVTSTSLWWWRRRTSYGDELW
ncbi:hypothetical protein Bca4012_082701 [Brassica carinata]